MSLPKLSVRAVLPQLSCNWCYNFYSSIYCAAHFIYILFIYKLLYKAPQGRNFRGAVSSQRLPKPSPVIIAPTHGGSGQAEWRG